MRGIWHELKIWLELKLISGVCERMHGPSNPSTSGMPVSAHASSKSGSAAGSTEITSGVRYAGACH